MRGLRTVREFHVIRLVRSTDALVLLADSKNKDIGEQSAHAAVAALSRVPTTLVAALGARHPIRAGW